MNEAAETTGVREWDWSAVYREEAPRLAALARRRYRLTTEECEDALQTVAMKILYAGPAVRDRQAYLTTSFLNECIKILERRLRERPTTDDQLDSEHDPTEAIRAGLAVRRALHRLAPHCRSLVSAWGLEGRTVQDAARKSELSTATAYKRLAKCLGKFIACL